MMDFPSSKLPLQLGLAVLPVKYFSEGCPLSRTTIRPHNSNKFDAAMKDGTDHKSKVGAKPFQAVPTTQIESSGLA